MLNPYLPPSTDPAAPPFPARWWQRPSLWLAWAEIVGGLALGLGGCAKSLATDASLALVGAVFVFGAGVVALAVPGAILLAVRGPVRWVAQALPLALVTWILVALARSE